jgi:hypothetical protein
MTESEVRGALAALFAGFEADGLRFTVTGCDGERAVVQMENAAEACEECVLPAASLEAIFTEGLRGAGFAGASVAVVDRTVPAS